MASLIATISGDDSGSTPVLIAHVNDTRQLLRGGTAYLVKFIHSDDDAFIVVPASTPTATNDWFVLYDTDGATKRVAILYNGVIDSDVATGTAPLQIASTTVVTNLNADLTDGLHIQSAGTGSIVCTGGAATLTDKTLTTPTIGDFTNAGHTHAAGAGGGVLTDAAIALTTAGDIVYSDGTNLVRLAIGTAKYLLQVNTGATAPEWESQAAALELTTAGDLPYATSNVAITRLGIGTAGQVLRVNSGATAPEWGQVARIVRKSADETVNNSSTMQDDDALKFTVAANTNYAVLLHVWSNSNSTANIKFGWSFPASTTIVWSMQFFNTGGTWTSSGTQQIQTGTQTVRGDSAAEECYIWAMVKVAGTAGTVALQWAQDLANASDTKVLADSWMSISQV